MRSNAVEFKAMNEFLVEFESDTVNTVYVSNYSVDDNEEDIHIDEDCYEFNYSTVVDAVMHIIRDIEDYKAFNMLIASKIIVDYDYSTFTMHIQFIVQN